MARKLTSHELRQIAEAADGTRHKPLFVVMRNNKPEVVDVVQAGDETLFECETLNKVPPDDKTEVQEVFLRVEGETDPGRILQECDAMFFTESAIRKFLVPYYASVLDTSERRPTNCRTNPNHLDCIWEAFNSQDTFAMVHLPRSTYEGVDSLGVVVKRGKHAHDGLDVVPLSQFLT